MKDVTNIDNQHVTSVGQRKNLESPTGFEHIMISQTQGGGGKGALPLSYGEIHGHILGSYLMCVLHTARISNVESVMYEKRKMTIELSPSFFISISFLILSI